jgi:broad specificity phosphatase PhoE
MLEADADHAVIAAPDPLPSALAADTTVWLIRHGETEWSRSGRHTSRTDLPLTRHGQEQAMALQDMLAASPPPTLVLCSPRQRAVETATLAGLTVDEYTEDLSEWNYGAYEGLTSAQIHETDPQWSIWTHESPGGETIADITLRVDRVIAAVLAQLRTKPDGPVVIVGHGHLNRVVAARWLRCDATTGQLFSLGPAAPCVLGAEHGLPTIARWNLPNPADTR